ncbi:MAG: cytochrome c [Ignavibacterium sp.]|uniref:virulence protein RhuM/Fic/DOC family protein n=1 Tax=Ignavibacterium sp. TaxID=2651167 RepID=UPI0021DC3E6F|nr:virulence protein RhuM/Fic/DOC family protein [Ignavibacterium sp.]BDQ04478.1 MAG: cytochrome c [Ignavibacterium sp.]GIV46313.1 MAG: cytochrome c [Ignavibacterium sp.]
MKKFDAPRGEIVIYKASDGSAQLDVKLEEESVWLTQAQMVILFQTTKQNVSLHINNIFKEGELSEKSVVKEYLTTAADGKKYKTKYYNLDVIISVGYRVKSKRGTQFRIWANNVIKEYLVKGYALNEKRLKEQTEKIKELEKTLEIFSNVVEHYQLNRDEFSGILKIVKDYTRALDLLDDYDHQRLKIERTSKNELFRIDYDSAKKVIKKLKEKFGGSKLFGKEKDQSFRGTIGAIYQTFGKNEVYPSIEEKAAHLLYFTIKNHSFVDGNKRIAAALFLWFLEMNNYLYGKNGRKRIADNALVALCLLIAESNPKEKDVIVKVVVNLINKLN